MHMRIYDEDVQKGNKNVTAWGFCQKLIKVTVSFGVGKPVYIKFT